MGAFDHGVEIGRCHVHVSGLEGALVVRIAHRQRRDRGEQVPQHGRVGVGGAVLDDDESRAELGRQPPEKGAERLQAAPRRTHCDEVAGDCLRRIHLSLRYILASASTTS